MFGEFRIHSEWTIKNSGFMGVFFWWFSANFGLWCSHKTHRHFAVNYRGFHGFCPKALRQCVSATKRKRSEPGFFVAGAKLETCDWMHLSIMVSCVCINKSLFLSLSPYICIYICRYMSTIQYLARINIHIHSTDIHWLIQTKYQLVECTEPDTASFPRSWTWKLRIVSACDLVMPTIIAPLCNAFAGNWVELG